MRMARPLGHSSGNRKPRDQNPERFLLKKFQQLPMYYATRLCSQAERVFLLAAQKRTKDNNIKAHGSSSHRIQTVFGLYHAADHHGSTAYSPGAAALSHGLRRVLLAAFRNHPRH